MASWAWPGPWQSSGGVDGWEVERRIMQEKKREATEKARRPSPQTEPLPPNKTKSFPLLEMSSHHSLLRCGLRKWPPKYPKKGGLGQGERLGEVKTCKTGGGGRPTLSRAVSKLNFYCIFIALNYALWNAGAVQQLCFMDMYFESWKSVD